MAAVTLTPDDLAPFAEIELDKALAMIEDVMALAARVAPCIVDADFEHATAARAVLRRAVLRWNEAGSGVVTQRQQTAGSFSAGESYDNRQTAKGMFWPSEIEQLQDLCRDQASGSPKAYMIDQVPTPAHSFADRPDLWFQWVMPVPPNAP